MFLIILLILITAAISGSAEYFSVFGLAQMFSASPISACIMGAALGAGKLIAASFLYQYWKKIGVALKCYLIFAVICLMAITSIGVFGYLSSAYQKDIVSLKDNQQKIEYLIQEKQGYNLRLADLNAEIKNAPSDQVNRKIRLIKTLDAEKRDILVKLDGVNQQLEPLLSTKLENEAKVGPIVFVAKALGKPTDDATLYMIFIIMTVFDPLALALTVATNFAIKHRGLQTQTITVIDVPETPVTTTPQIDHTETLNNMSDKLSQIHSALDVDNKRVEILNHVRDIDN